MRYDTIIVGGGTAGCILAAHLSEDLHRSRAGYVNEVYGTLLSVCTGAGLRGTLDRGRSL